jgi:hypothetical protein
VSSTRTKTVDCPNLTFSENERSIADGKISLNVSRRVVSSSKDAFVRRSPAKPTRCNLKLAQFSERGRGRKGH